MSEKFVKKNQIVLRKIEVPGDQTLEDLHLAIFDTFDREEMHLYEYQIGGKGPNDPKAVRYGTPDQSKSSEQLSESCNDASTATIDSLNLKTDDVFGYWFDFGDDWWHQINVSSINKISLKELKEKYPKVIDRKGKSPPQYLDFGS
jgi:hypothetical protein